MQRHVVVSIDTILNLFKDYCGQEDIPEDSQATRLVYNPTNRGKIGLEIESDSIKPGMPAVQVHFDLKRVYSV